jgi:hypothetical protein
MPTFCPAKAWLRLIFIGRGGAVAAKAYFIDNRLAQLQLRNPAGQSLRRAVQEEKGAPTIGKQAAQSFQPAAPAHKLDQFV